MSVPAAQSVVLVNSITDNGTSMSPGGVVSSASSACDSEQPISDTLTLSEALSLQLRRDFSRSMLGALLLLLLRIFISLVSSDELQEGLGYLVALLSIQVSIVIVAFAASSLFAAAWEEVRSRRVGTNICEAVAILALLGSQTYALFYDIDSLLSLPLYSSVPVIVGLLMALRLVEQSVSSSFGNRLGFSLKQLAPKVLLYSAAEPAAEKWIPARLAQVGDIFLVRSGEIVALDAEILAGKAQVIEHRFGGGPVPRYKSKGQGVFAGSVVDSGELQCRAVNTQEDAVYENFLEGIGSSVQTSRHNDLAQSVDSATGLALVFLAACAVLFWHERGASVIHLGLVVGAVLICGVLPRVMRLLAQLPPLTMSALFVRGATLRDESVIARLAGLKNLVLDYESIASARRVEILRFEIVDQRLDANSLVSVLLALFGDGDDDLSCEAVQSLRKLVKQAQLFELENYHYYPGKGIIGTVHGAEFSVGAEPFLLERRVHIQPTDIVRLKDGEEAVYVAMGAEVVARFITRPHSRSEERQLLEKLSALRVRTLLCGPEPSEQVDALAKEIGVELPSSYGGLSGEGYKDKVLGWKPVGFYSRLPPSATVAKFVDVSLSHFNELQWNDRATDVTIYERGLSLIGTVIESCRFSKRVGAMVLYPAIGLSILVLAAAFLAFFPAALVVTTVGAAYAAAAVLIMAAGR